MKVVGIYLAAGDSSRMGTNKLLLNMNGTPLGSLALQAVLESAIHHVLVITRKENEFSWIAPHFFTSKYRQKWTSVQLKKSHQGQAYSIKCGLTKAIDLHADAVLIQLADQPFMNTRIINLLIEAFRKDPLQSFFACQYQGILRPPVLFTKRFFPKLMSLQGDKGAGNLLNGEFKDRGKVFGFDHEDYFLDVDTMDDYVNCRTKQATRE
jgi:molybdenum cofactor cytidylyltransferase